MSATAGDDGGRCHCGARWFRLIASAECDEPGQVTIDERGLVTAHAGALVCASCGTPWARPRQRLSVVRQLPPWDEATDAECDEILASEDQPWPPFATPDRPNRSTDERRHHPTKIIRAPFTLAQVRALNAWQSNPRLHPFTCANDMHAPGAHSGPYIGRFGQQRVLVATPAGWMCSDPNCGYTQDWAHAVMAT